MKLLDHWDLSDSRVVNGRLRPIREIEVRYLGFLKILCEELDRAAGISRRQVPTYGDLVAHYNSEALQAVLPETTTETNRIRRADELNWRSAVEAMKEEKRRRLL